MSPRIKVYPADVGGCGYNRMIWPGEALGHNGHDVDVIRADEAVDRQIQAVWWHAGGDDRKVIDVLHPDADVIVLQRPLTDTLRHAIPLIQAKGIRVVVEIDDDFEAISPANVSYRRVHPKHSPRRNWKHLAASCQLADWVVVSTPTLADIYGRHGRVSIVPNCVPAHYLDFVRPWHDGVWVGWSGSTETHPHDLQVTRGAVAQAVDSAGANFAVIGSGKGVRKALGLRSEVRASGWQEIDIYPQMVAELDVGIVPLELTRFNQAKSALKMMEYAALGVAAVGSPTVENVRMAGEGVGLIAENQRHWLGILRRLIADEGYRAEVVDVGRRAMAAWTYEARCELWLDAWTAPLSSPTRKVPA